MTKFREKLDLHESSSKIRIFARLADIARRPSDTRYIDQNTVHVSETSNTAFPAVNIEKGLNYRKIYTKDDILK